MATPKMPTAQPFTINNLPYGVISTKTDTSKRCATVLNNHAIDLSVLHSQGVFSDIPGLVDNVFAQGNVNDFAKLPKETRIAVREKLQAYLAVSEPTSPVFIPLAEVENHFPMETRNFSDFYCSLEHTINCTKLLLNKTDINPNWYTVPMVYNGRTSSLVVSGTPVHRPCGVFPTEKSNGKPTFQPEIHMDFELEMGVFLSKPLDRGQRLDINTCRDHIFGFVLLNDWSARNIQLFEMAPLGPFHSKGSGTSISPWIVTAEALEPILCLRVTPQTVSPPAHLTSNENADATYDIELSVRIQRNGQEFTVCDSNLNELYWTPLQQLTHLASAGEGLSTGDIFGTGTISSSRTNEKGEKSGLGCLFERKDPANRLSSAASDLADTFLMDGDRVVFEGWCRNPETKEVLFGFGTCEGELLSALPL